ncbi:MAG TPA: mechanosensitive ion channel domain-containing protein [Longimicrobiales bacterium]|nr:mechanosensitive ion channel domain-containing protein [Longimicrobiales bacterium]
MRVRRSASAARRSAQGRLKKFRQGSMLAVAITGLFLLLWGRPEDAPAQQTPGGTVADTAAVISVPDTAAVRDSVLDTMRADPGRSVEEATSTVRRFALDFTTLLPKILIALGLLLAAAIIVRLVRAVLRRILGEWEKADAATAIAGILIWLLAIGIALSIIAGDTRTLIGSVGLLGLALSWALQAPIESFAGWLLNSFKGYYRVGDRIAVGEVFGDVYRIDYLNTTVWEAGGPDKPVQGAQPTGALITFPNSEVLRSNIVNYTRGFPYVWDEINIGISNESDLGYAMRTIAAVAREVVGPVMQGPVDTYRAILDQEGLAYDVADEPQVYLAPTESWTDVVVRYLVDARERRKWSSALHLRIGEAIAEPEHRERIRPAYPVRVTITPPEGSRP